AVLLAGGAACAAYGLWRRSGEGRTGLPEGSRAASPVSEDQIQRFCSSHHGFPPPSIFPRQAWVKVVDRMYSMGGYLPQGMIGLPPREEVLAWYQARAPEKPVPVYGQGALGP